MAKNELFQYSVVSALMDGVASHGLPIATLMSYGNHGLGTFRSIMGELIIIDGRAYQMKSDGTVATVDTSPEADVITPFAMITRFEAEATAKATLANKDELAALLTKMLPRTRNSYLAIRLDGVFHSATVRTVGGQSHPGEKLAELGKRQTSNTFEDKMRGTVIGFRSPKFLQGVSVAGDHLHFISEDRKRGGHLLAFATEGEIEIRVAAISRVVLELPKGDDEFDEAMLEKDEEGIKAVEG